MEPADSTKPASQSALSRGGYDVYAAAGGMTIPLMGST